MNKDLNWLSMPSLFLSVLLIAFSTKKSTADLPKQCMHVTGKSPTKKSACRELNIPSGFTAGLKAHTSPETPVP